MCDTFGVQDDATRREDLMEHVGEAVRFYRKRAAITQEELARRAEIAPTSVVRLETGEVKQPRYGTLMKLARALEVNPAEFVRFISDVGKPAALGEGMTVPEPPSYVGNELPGPFTAVFERDGEWWIGYVEELPGANAQGESLQECRESLREAVSLVLEANRELTRREFEGRDVVREPIGA
jgi:transcriptional regulator with XRE-family HTH domain